MSSGFCVRVFFLSLLGFGQHAKAFSYRSGDSSDLSVDFPSSSKTAFASFSYADSAQPEGSSGISGPSNAEDSLENLRRAAVPPRTRGYGGSYGRQLGGHTLGSLPSSFKPDQWISSNLRESPQQQHYQNNPQNILSPQKTDRYDLGIVSSPAIEMHFGQSEPKTKLQHLSYPIPHPGQPQQSSQQVWPQQPSHEVHHLAGHLYPIHLAQYLRHPVFRPARPQQLSYGMSQGKPGMWMFPVPHSEKRFESGILSSYNREVHSGSQAEAQKPSHLTSLPPADPNPQTGAEAGRPRPFRKVLVYGPGGSRYL